MGKKSSEGLSLDGELPRRPRVFVVKWASLHREELRAKELNPSSTSRPSDMVQCLQDHSEERHHAAAEAQR